MHGAPYYILVRLSFNSQFVKLHECTIIGLVWLEFLRKVSHWNHETLNTCRFCAGAWQRQMLLPAQEVPQTSTLGSGRCPPGQIWIPWPGLWGPIWSRWGAWVRWGWEALEQWGGWGDPRNSEGLVVGRSSPPTCRFCSFTPFFIPQLILGFTFSWDLFKVGF